MTQLAMQQLTPKEQLKVSLYRRDPGLFVKEELDAKPSKDQLALLNAVSDLNLKNIIVCAGRGAGKTIDVSWITDWNEAVLCHYFDKYETYVLGGSLEQSKRLYEYFRGDIYKTPLLEKRLADKPTMRNTRFINGKVQALAASSKQVRGPHPECLILDEVCEADDEIILDAMPMVLGSLHGRTIMLSTPHKFFGIFQEIWDNYKDYEYKRFGPWSLLDCDWITEHELKIFKKLFTPDRYTYEVEGKFPRFGKLLFNKRWVDNCTAEHPFAILPKFKSDWGIDWGDTDALTAGVPIQYYGKKVMVPGPDILYEDTSAPEIIEDLGLRFKLSNGESIYADAAQRGNNDFLEDELANQKCAGADLTRIYFSKDKSKMQINLQMMLYHNEIMISPDNIVLLDQLKKYRLKAKGKAKPKNQDAVDALMLAVFQFADQRLLENSSLADKFKLA